MSSDGETPERVAIGISFGNSYSSIACTVSSDALVIANEEGDRQIPSILSYVDGEEFHGTQAKAQLVRNPKNTCAGFRDFLGKNFDAIDPTPCQASARPQPDSSTIAFSIADTEGGEAHPVTVSEITTRHLRRLKNSAADYLGREVTAAVITVPTDFSQSQKDALTAAAQAAGLEILQIILEPVAALLAHDRRNVEKPQDKIVVVADLGGTRSDATVISIKGGMYSIIATKHDYSLGGAQLDQVLVDYFAKEFQKKNKTDPRGNERSLAKLRLEAESCKKALSLGSSAGFTIESLADGIDYSSTVNRSRFELLSGKIFASFIQLIEGVVHKAGLDVLDIDDIILAGGTSHTPRIAANLRNHFPASTTVTAPSTSAAAISPSELAVRGAALQAYLIEGFEAEDIEQSTHPAVTVTPHLQRTLGIIVHSSDAGAEKFKPVIPAETPLPVRRTVQFTNASSTPSSNLLIRLCEGEREIKVTKPDPKPKANGGKADNADDDSDFGSDDDDDEPDEVREKVWATGAALGELALRDVKKDAKVTLQVSVSAELDISVSAMQVGAGKPGVRGTVPGHSEGANGAPPNGSAH